MNTRPEAIPSVQHRLGGQAHGWKHSPYMPAVAFSLLVLLLCPAAGQGTEVETKSAFLNSAEVRFRGPTAEVPHLRRHVVPLLSRLGCNAAACHGSKEGQGGFKLSLFGYDYNADVKELADEGNPPRANWKDPANSAILLKPTLQEDHEGGERFSPDGWEHRLILNWVTARAPGVDPRDATIVDRLEIRPAKVVLSDLHAATQLQVVAHWSDGSSEDVTPLCRFQTNDDSIAMIDPSGLVSATGYGDTHIIAFYDKAVAPAAVYVPRSAAKAVGLATSDARPIDRFVETKLAELGIQPSGPCTEEEFLRRACLDVTGTLPTVDEVKRFLASDDAEKRAAKIEQLLSTREYAAWWTTWLCDLTGNSEDQMPSPKFRYEESRQWYDWLYRRVETNTPYDQLVEGMVVAESRSPGQSYEDYCTEMSSYVRSQGPAEFAHRDTMPHFWARTNLKGSANKTMAFAHVFLGVQIQCAECHKHPFDRWTKEDFDGLEEFFAPLKYGRAGNANAGYRRLSASIKVPPGQRRNPFIASLARSGSVIPWNELYYDQPSVQQLLQQPLSDGQLRRATPMHALMDWMRGLEHPYLAMAFVNRVWHQYFGVGIVDPPDDLSLANPPSNQALLDYLTAGFVDSGYDMKWLHREILNSNAYQRSWRTTETNIDDSRNFSHAKLRRLPAEVLYDAVLTATAADQAVAVRSPRRAVGLSAGMMRSDRRNEILQPLGKPARAAVCERERSDEPNLSQSLFLQNDPVIYRMMDAKDGWIELIIDRDADATPMQIAGWIEEAFLRTLSRAPSREEIAAANEFIAESGAPADGLRGLLWSLINTKEFCLNQ